jgi:hypothetical protein
MLLVATAVKAQITIGGNVYGGGNEGDVGGNTKVTVRAGDVHQVFGGARMADVKGNAFVNIDGEHASAYIIINKVYGGNDISGEIGDPKQAQNPVKKLPVELDMVATNNITKDWDAFVKISTKTEKVEGKVQETSNAQKIYIGQLFGGGNGDYDYTSSGTYNGLKAPDLRKTYLELLGGSIVNVFGGGNVATVTEDVVIHLDNPSKVVNHIKVKDGKEDDVNGTDLLTEDRFIKMGINYKFTYPNSASFQFGNLFGGNNKVDMAIQPKWNLLGGMVRNLYSGGNEGRMTCPQGLLLQIPEESTLIVDNVYGGCRKADVRPLDAAGKDVPNAQIQLEPNPTGIPAGFSAHTRILGGNINNVYGGNDISGNVYGGNTVAILTTIHGNVYGGGNGSYAYTDNPALKDELLWRDFYYNPKEILGLSGDTFTGLQSAEALNKVRPNAEQVSLLLRGTADKPVFVEGSVFVGGNSASLQNLTDIANRQAHVKIGSYVTIDNLFLGNNGENMVKTDEEVRNEDGLVQSEGVLRTIANTTIAGSKFNSMDLTQSDVFDKYMEGCAMKVMPSVVFDDVENYTPYSSQFGSLYCGGNVGSMMTDGLTEISFVDKAIIYDKIVGGCNKANVDAGEFNAAYEGGLIGEPDSHGDKLKLNFSGLKIQPMRWKDPNDKSKLLEWNTVVYNATTQQFDNVENVKPTEPGQNITSTDADIVRRLKGGNLYGGCYESGHVNGNVILNINETLMERDKLFDLTDEGDTLYVNTEKGKYTITKRNTGVILSEQGMDVLGDALNVFGAGYGAASEIWGSTTINLNKGYVFQIFGGGEMGAVGKKDADGKYGKKRADGTYGPDEKYSTYINLKGSVAGVSRATSSINSDMAECEFIYGGAFEGVIAGDIHINLGNGRIFNSFAGSCNADVLGHTETYIGRNGVDANGNDIAGFPWIRDHLYGGNDLGGRILGDAKFSSRIRDDVKGMVAGDYGVSSYMEYTQGRVRYILGGCFGDYDYNNDPAYKVGTGADCRVAQRPYLHNSFVNFRPNSNANNRVEKIFGAGEGYPGDREGDKGQDHSYVLIDIPDNVDNFANTEIFGAGAYNGVGMRYTAGETFAEGFDLNEATAVIDLLRGRVGAAYGGSYEEGVTRRTLVNVPVGSTIKIGSIFGGAYGSDAYLPCDVYEANVNYLTQSENAYLISDPTGSNQLMKGAIYGGNNHARRTLYGKVNISAPVRQKHPTYGMTTATVYGAGSGSLTWNEYTEVNLNAGASVWEVYGGGEAGGVMSAESVQKYISDYKPDYWPKVKDSDPNVPFTAAEWTAAWTLGSGYDPATLSTGYVNNKYTNLTNPLARKAEIDDRELTNEQKARIGNKYNTNVLIYKGAYVGNYAYGGGLGNENDAFVGSGDVYGTTYIALLGGIVNKDIYAAGTSGAVYNIFGAENMTASTNAFIAGGTVRNVYGGGWKGNVGYHDEKTTDTTNDIPGETHVVIGIRRDQSTIPSDYGFYNGVPAIQRNAYGGGEGGAIYGTTHLTLNNGYIGYVYLQAGETLNEQGKIVAASGTTEPRYVEKVDDETYWTNDVWSGVDRLKDCGNLFGGGYDVLSSVDFSNVTMWNGIVRNSVVGGGEVATIGRGAIEASGPSNSIRTLKGIYKAGKTNVEIYNGHVLRNVYGGGKGYNIFGYGQQGTLYMDGYVFGQTEVHVHGGEIGTTEGVAEGYGNVFGGGDIGYVYSPSIYSDKTKAKIGTGSPGHIYYYGADGKLTEDCKVVIAPYLQVKNGYTITYNGKTYNSYDYVPTDYLNTLPKKNESGTYVGTEWEKLFTGDTAGEEERGIYIRNAVFAGGNVASNSEQTYANATTIYGNTTATLYDVYHRDFITVGTEHTGGVYGGGNLSVVDGYRELNITNYGTDYYGLKQTISIDEYRSLSNRERAYFQLEYKCLADVTIGGVFYEKDKRLTEEEYLKLLSNEAIASQVKASFEPYGFCSIYAGRLLNTIQRADLCGVFGSRMVLQGAKDRVAEVGEAIDYTINRVGELSLNRQHSARSGEKSEDATHGNYFGIYSLVNYLGNLTSDVKFGSDYVNGDGITSTDGTTYYSYKSSKHTSSDRNKGQSSNQVALASGVFLELLTENSTKEHKEYGYVTGVVELDLINVKKDMVGGGFVYAKNEHRVPMYYPNKSNVLLSEYNKPKSEGGKQPDEARTYKRYRYSLDQEGDWSESAGSYVISGDNSHVYQTMEWHTSGNFIHPSKRIVDDCYPTNNSYVIGSANYSEAHYWYVKGEVYIYDQKVSAYTGSANAYSKEVHLPLTITAASNGKLQLLNVKPNLYAYKTDKNGTPVKIGTMGNDGKPIDKVFVNNESDSYGLNDVISWWDWHQLSASDRQYFVTETYVNCVTVNVDGVEYEPGTYVMDQRDYDLFMANNHDIRDSKGEKFKDDDGHDIGKTFAFRSSNNISHETGYLLTFDMNTPKIWDDYYSPQTGSSSEGKIMKSEYEAKFTDGMSDAQRQAVIDAWREGPTFTPTETGVYGKRSYRAGEVVTKETYDNAGEGKEKMEKAYVATETVTYTYNGTTKTVNAGTAISKTEYDNIGTYKNSFAEAWYCTNSVKLTNENYLLYGELKTAAEIAALKAISSKEATDAEIDAALTPAYICTQDGEYGGQRFDTGTNYSAIQAWSSLPTADRQKFSYNFDALDLLTDTDYLTVDPNVTTSPSHEETVATFHAPYTDQVDVEYQAVFKKQGVDVKFNGSNLADGAVLSNKEFETIRNDKRHYTHVETKNNGDDVYIAKNHFVYLGTPYGRGQVVDADVYNANASDVEAVRFPTAGEWYYCYEDYVAENGSTVSKGTTITKAEYGVVPNYQQYFIIQGEEPTETTTLYVSRESNAYDVMKEKIITVVYQYTYYEDEDDGSVKLNNELHVINVHLDLESGVPQIGQLSQPAVVLPGNVVGLKAPEVNPGLYEVLTSGWEIYTSQDDAENHRNGAPFENNNTPVYFYQNQKHYVTFYSKTYLGKTYSNAVPLRVANYHDLAEVLDDPNLLYIDRSDVDRNCKVYINDYSKDAEPKNGLDLLKKLFDEKATGYIKGCDNLDIILRTDLDHSGSAWTGIGGEGNCFEGDLHGDGHTITGLSSSLFGSLCGSVYNLGVTGSFTGGGIAEQGDGYAENCWVSTTGTVAAGTKAIIGNPTRGVAGSHQMVNCYYPETNAYTAYDGTKAMSQKAFYGGEVAYKLNGFLLNKRQYDNTSSGSLDKKYYYLPLQSDQSLPETMSEGSYPGNYAIYPLTTNRTEPVTGIRGYVEQRFSDGDYRYAAGTIPETSDIRMRNVTIGAGTEAEETMTYYVPVWPDDYLYFGQKLTYGYVDGQAHQDYPSALRRDGELVKRDENGNRVFRAPAYFGSSTIGEAFFNQNAVFASAKKDDENAVAYKGLTAIDFSGASGNDGEGLYYPPLLDDDGLVGFQNVDLTKNLLVYTKTTQGGNTAADKTTSVVANYLQEPTYDDYETNATYKTVSQADSNHEHGHWVCDGVAYRDHFLVDKEDFNCPIEYTFTDDKRMWYQRLPERYVTAEGGSNKGWLDISLPFKVETVSTQTKGELTHFYQGSTTGHEYWLRELTDVNKGTPDDLGIFQYLMTDPYDGDKEYTNTYLYDHYYKYSDYRDANSDQYQKEYYASSHTFVNYPRQKAGVPYLIGFPGKYYYEFDLSGEWTGPYHTYSRPENPGQQLLTFVSSTGAKIGVSDTEMKKVSYNGYQYCANYGHKTLASGADNYMLDNEGSKYAALTAETTVLPFRVYFTRSASTSTRTEAAHNVLISDLPPDSRTRGIDDENKFRSGELIVKARNKVILITSELNYKTDVSIVTPAGVTLSTFAIAPDETVATRVASTGVYIVYADNGRYVKKIIVK